MFKTVPICILTAGHTIDGREVKPETLHEMAETYDPKVYNAAINIEHNRYGSKLGAVLSLKVKEIGETVKLFAELKPNNYMLYLIQQGQKLHTSCEIVHNFAKTGKAYLTGLAVTDTPASLGTTEMHLSANDQQAEVFTTDGEPIPSNEDKDPVFKNPFSKKEDNSMEKATLELVQQLSDQQAQTAEALSSLAGKIDGLNLGAAAQPEEQDRGKADEGSEDEPTELSSVLGVMQEMQTTIQALSKTSEDTAKLLTQLSEETDDNFRHQATGEDNDKPDHGQL